MIYVYLLNIINKSVIPLSVPENAKGAMIVCRYDDIPVNHRISYRHDKLES